MACGARGGGAGFTGRGRSRRLMEGWVGKVTGEVTGRTGGASPGWEGCVIPRQLFPTEPVPYSRVLLCASPFTGFISSAFQFVIMVFNLIRLLEALAVRKSKWKSVLKAALTSTPSKVETDFRWDQLGANLAFCISVVKLFAVLKVEH